jgi:3-dehydrosphinganine reductase
VTHQAAWHHKVAIVTGGSSGIGLAVARRLAAQGAHVWIIARRQDMLEAAQAQIQAACPDRDQCCGAISADLTDPSQAANAVYRVIEATAVPDLLINSAGVAHPGYVQDLELDIFHWMMEVNYFGTVNMVKAVLPAMILRHSGHIVNVSSVAGLIGVFGYTAYGASKFAVTGFTEALRAEARPYGVRVSIVFPPDTDTPQLAYENQFKPPETKALAGAVKAMSADQVAEATLRQAARGRYAIFASPDSWLLSAAWRWLGSLTYPIVDWIIARARRA